MADLQTLLSTVREESTMALAGLVGGLISMKFTPGSAFQKLTSIPIGFACAVFFTHPITRYFQMTYESPEKDGVSFLVGLFGFAVVHKLFEVLHGIDAATLSAVITRAAGKKTEE